MFTYYRIRNQLNQRLIMICLILKISYPIGLRFYFSIKERTKRIKDLNVAVIVK